MSLNAEIIAVGTELTNGAKLDTNSQWLSRELEDLGHPVAFHTTVADNLGDQVTTLRRSLDRSDLVLMTGGLGPTLDDLARDAIAAAIGEELVLDPVSLAEIEAFFASRGRAMPERNRIQAMFPRGTLALPNPIGTAPGIWLSLVRDDGRTCYVTSLPGVPSEMKRMFHEQVCPRLPKSSLLIRKHVWHCFGLGESDVEQRLGDLTARGRTPEVGITAHEATISLRIVARGTSESECQTQIDAASEAIHAALGDRVFGSGETELEDVVLRQLSRRGWTLVTLEYGSSAYLAPRLIRAATISDNGPELVAGSYCFASALLAQAQFTSRMSSAGQRASLKELAQAAREFAGGNVCLAVAYPPPAEASTRNVGEVVAIGPDFAVVQHPAMLGAPDIQHSRLAKTAVDVLRRQLREMTQ